MRGMRGMRFGLRQRGDAWVATFEGQFHLVEGRLEFGCWKHLNHSIAIVAFDVSSTPAGHSNGGSPHPPIQYPLCRSRSSRSEVSPVIPASASNMPNSSAADTRAAHTTR